MSKLTKVLLIAVLALIAPVARAQFVSGTLAAQQHGGSLLTATLVQNVTNNACSGSTASCSITSGNGLVATTVGNYGVIEAMAGNGNATVIASVSTGGTFLVPGGCAATTANLAVSCAYLLSLTTSVTTITVTWSNSTPGNFVSINYREYHCSGGTCAFALDTGASGGLGTLSNTASSSTPPGVALTLAGTNDVIVQAIKGYTTAPTSVSTYTDFLAMNVGGSADLLNTSSGAAPTWTFGQNQSVSLASAIAVTVVP